MKAEHKKIIHDLFARLPEFTYIHPEYGKFFSGYGTGLFTCECYFDALLVHLADYDTKGEIASNFIRLLLSLQNPQTGHIPRHTIDLVDDPNKLEVKGWSSMSTFINGRQMNPWTWYEADEHAQPFLYQIASIACRAKGGSTEWITDEIYDGLKKYVDCWLQNWDRTGEGLCVVASAQHGLSDNSFPRAGTWRSYFSQIPEFNALLYVELKCAAKIARSKGRTADAAYFESEAEIKKQRVNEMLWDEAAGCYYPRDIRTGKLIKVDAINHYMTLFTGIVPPDHAKRMIEEHLFNPKKFYTKYPFASYALDEKTYTQLHINDSILLDDYTLLPKGHCNWRGGTWSHPHFMIVMALQRYGYEEKARDIADKIFDLTIHNPYICEWHNAETGEMQGAEIFAGVQIFQRLMPTLLEIGFEIDHAEDALDKPIDNSKFLDLLKI